MYGEADDDSQGYQPPQHVQPTKSRTPDSDHHISEVKPPPRRQYETNNSSSTTLAEPMAPRALTVQEFETMRQQARNQPQNLKLQLQLVKKYVEASTALTSKYSDGNTPASGPVDAKTERRNADSWLSMANKLTKKLVSQQYPEAIFYSGTCYSSGTMGLEPDYDRAYELYSKAAKLEHPEATYRLAVCNEIGAGTKRDPLKALQNYRRAASLGDVSAMYKLGMISLNGLLGQRRSFPEAITWLQRAADKADSETPHAVHELGLLYERADSLDLAAMGEDGKPIVFVKDEKKAYDLFVKAAKLGYPPSQFRLGCAYEYGTLGCQINPKRSIAWYSKAAEKGEPESELALSGWYLTGSEGILQQSDTEAYLWARRAAEKGLAKAEYALGYFSEVGLGVRPDLEEAKRWYFKAASQRHPKALSRLQELKQDGR
jgi:TPR repeat protein